MNISFGIYDVFAYAVPGSLYLALGVFLADRIGWINPGHLGRVPTVILAAAIIVLSYLLGYVTYPLASVMDKALGLRKSSDEARADFIARVPGAKNRPYVQADMGLLKAAVEVFDLDQAQEVSRLRAVGIMTRNCSLPMIIASVVSLVSAAQGRSVAISVVGIIVFAASGGAAIWNGRRFRHWANLKTLEICYWSADIDELVTSGQPSRRRARPPARSRKSEPPS